MSSNMDMYELRERKQRQYEAVCSDFRLNHNMEELAIITGMKSGTLLRNRLNPEQPHKLDPVDLAMLCKASNDYTILNTMFADLGVVTIALPEQQDEKSYFERTLLNSKYSGELSSDALDMCNAERLPRSKKRKTLAKAQGALSNLVLLINDLENRTTGLQPILQFGTDFLANGAPLPGLM